MFRIYEDIIYNFHVFFQRYYERLEKDALCVRLKAELNGKAIYHGLKAYSIVRKGERIPAIL